MKNLVSKLILLYFCSNSFGQDSTIIKQKSIFGDTSLIRTSLIDKFPAHDRIVKLNFSTGTIIYLSEQSILDTLLKAIKSSYAFERQNSKSVLKLLKHNKNLDTILLKQPSHYFYYLVSLQLKKGKAKVFDKKTHSFVSIIYQRVERVISNAYRVYYFEDKRRFFQSKEWIGIKPNELMPDIE